MNSLAIPPRLAENCAKTPERQAWLLQLPRVLRQIERRWALTLGEPYRSDEGSCAYVLRVMLANGTPAVLKLAMPHMEGEHEIDGLRFWNGDPTVRLLAADRESGAMLLV